MAVGSGLIHSPAVARDVVRRPEGSALGRFFERRGRRVVEWNGVLWYEAPHGFLMSLPYHRTFEFPRDEIRSMLARTKATGVRFATLGRGGLAAGSYVRTKSPYEIGTVHIKHRPRVRKGMENFEIRPVSEDDLLTQGIVLNRQSMFRQGRYDSEFGDQNQWREFVKAMRTSPEIAAIGSYAGDRLASYIITCREDGWLQILHQMSRTEDLKIFPNHYLTYHVTKAAMEDPELEGVCYGLVPLVSLEGLDEYKLRFGYEMAAHACAVQFHPRYDRLVNNMAARFGLGLLRRLRPGNQKLEMVSTVMRGAALTSRGETGTRSIAQ